MSFLFDQTNTDYGDPEAGIRVDNHTGHGDGPSSAPRWPTIGLYEGLHALTRGFGCWRATFGHNGARTAMGEDSDLLVLTKQIQIMANRRRGISVDIHAGGQWRGRQVWKTTRDNGVGAASWLQLSDNSAGRGASSWCGQRADILVAAAAGNGTASRWPFVAFTRALRADMRLWLLAGH